jgi:hypothetical protein
MGYRSYVQSDPLLSAELCEFADSKIRAIIGDDAVWVAIPQK